MAIDLENACLTVDEVLSDSYAPLPVGARDEARAQARLERWRTISAHSGKEEFSKRLRRQGLDEADLQARLGGVSRRPGVPKPGWVAETDRIVALLRSGSLSPKHNDIAFGPLLTPVFELAERTLRARVPSAMAARLTATAVDGMVDHLRRRLSNLVEMPFYEALLDWRRELLDRIREGDTAATTLLANETLAPFHEHLVARGYDTLIERTPILFRLMAALVAQWLDVYRLFIDRLAIDLDHLALIAPGLSPDSVVQQIGWGHSDPHNGGHSVLSLSFSSGQRVFYKPKDMHNDLFVGTFISKLVDLGAPETLVVPKAIARENYGWTEEIVASPCQWISR